MNKEIFCTCILSVLSCSAQATTCTIPPTCTSLGYTQSASDCEGKNTIRCPTDSSALFCGGTTDGSITSPAKILYADHTVSSIFNPNKKAIGVVFDETKRRAVGLEYFINQPVCMSDSEGTYRETSNITSCNPDELNNCATDGKINTPLFKPTCSSSSPYMNMSDNGFLKTYVPAGCSSDWCGAGQWYIPSIAELRKIYANINNINAALALNGISGLLNTTCTKCWPYYDHYSWYGVFSSNVYHQTPRNKQPYSSIYIYDFNSDSVYTQGSSGYKKMILAIEY